MSLKGFPNQKKLTGALSPFTEAQCNNTNEFATVQPTYSNKNGLDSVQLGLYRTHASAKTATPDTAYPKRIFTSTAHGASIGDVIRFEPTATNPGFESGVLSVPDADTIILNGETPLAIVNTDTFFILRYITPRYGNDGSTVTTIDPAGLATAANQVTQIAAEQAIQTSAASIDTKLSSQATAANQATEITALGIIDTSINTLLKPSDTLAKVTEVTSILNPLPAGTNVIGHVIVDSSGLPTGAATAANQTNGSQKSQLVDAAGDIADVVPLSTQVVGTDKGIVANAVIHGLNTAGGGTYVDVKVNPSGTLTVDASGSTGLTGTVTANAGTNLNTSALALETTQAANGVLIGAVTETAPATDTASSGLNGRLQRIAQRITSLIALLPTALGQGTMATSFKVVLPSDQSAISTNATLSAETTKVIGNVGIVPSAVSTNALSSISSAANEASHVVKASAGRLYSFSGYNANAAAQFIQVHNTTSLPSNTTVPVITFTVPGLSNWSYDFPLGKYFSTGITVCNSSTQATLTVGTTDCWFNAEYL